MTRDAAAVTAGVAIVHVVGFLLLMPSSTSPSITSGSALSPSSAVMVTVHFDDAATPREMAAFFDGYNAGSTGTDGQSFRLDPAARRMTLGYESEEAAERFSFFARRSDLVVQVDVLTNQRRR